MGTLRQVKQSFMIGLNALKIATQEDGGRSTTARNQENVPLVQNLLEQDGRVTIEEIANEEQQLTQGDELSIATLVKMEANEDNNFKHYVNGDETWICQFDPENIIPSKVASKGNIWACQVQSRKVR
nr:hypothetical protein HmN_000998500 [Hymenolepis microstoma]